MLPPRIYVETARRPKRGLIVKGLFECFLAASTGASSRLERFDRRSGFVANHLRAGFSHLDESLAHGGKAKNAVALQSGIAESEEYLLDEVLARMASKRRPRENRQERQEMHLFGKPHCVRHANQHREIEKYSCVGRMVSVTLFPVIIVDSVARRGQLKLAPGDIDCSRC